MMYRNWRSHWLAISASWLLCFQSQSASGDDDSALLEARVTASLSRKCVSCHRPDNAKGDLDLTTREGLLRGGIDGVAITLGNAETSPIYTRSLVVDDLSPEMPEQGEALTAEESRDLKRWIEAGAPWSAGLILKEQPKADQRWWAFQPLAIGDSQQQRQTVSPESIDQFIQSKLEQSQLAFSPEADRRTLIRRLAFDLHGLPPTYEAVEAFVNDPDPQAYAKLVDRYLDSPLYGERLAQHWLDIAHYADTHGFERDQRRDHAWHYRDYVIRSFNEDKPYDRFLQEQIAGDVLWPEGEQSVIGTGFLAAGPWDMVGQVETQSAELRRSARVLDLDDMVTQVMTATVAMTVNCARCHDHKLDPITQEEYYQLQSVFAGAMRTDRSASEKMLQHYEQTKDHLTDRLTEIEAEIRRLEGRGIDLAEIVGRGIDPRTGQPQPNPLGDLDDIFVNRYSTTEVPFIDGVFIPNGAADADRVLGSSSGLRLPGLPSTSGKAWDSIRNGAINNQHSTELGGIDFAGPEHSLLGIHANAGITFDLQEIARTLTKSLEPSDATIRFTAKVGYFGAPGDYHADAWVFVDGERVAQFKQLRRQDGLQSIDIEIDATKRFLTLVSTDGGNGYSMDQIGFGDPHVKMAVPLDLSDTNRTRLDELRLQRTEIDRQMRALHPPPTFFGVLADEQLPEVRLLTRGDPESPTGEPLPPAALTVLRMLDANLGTAATPSGDRRAALAAWITDRKNPLTPRVIVNRLWHWHFGKGIVDTPSDFGFGGGQPSHPELLDWLADELIRRNWSLKEIHRLILNSRTYRQTSYPVASRAAETANQIDSDNRLLWRQNPSRVEAEAIRDAVLFVSGKLNLERGGPGFEDFQYQEEYAPIYTYVTQDQPKLWRRSIYRFKVRTSPNRFLLSLDCPDTANLTPARLTTTTPLQSLTLYNNEFMLQQAQYLSERIKTEVGVAPRQQVRRAFELTLSRRPTEQESLLAERVVVEQGLFVLSRSLLNSNEFVYVD